MPLKNAKRKGSKNEYKSIRLMEASGYSCTRSAGSLGCFDVIAICSTDIALIQCKTNHGPSPLEVESIRNFIAPPNARKLIHIWKDRARLPISKEL